VKEGILFLLTTAANAAEHRRKEMRRAINRHSLKFPSFRAKRGISNFSIVVLPSRRGHFHLCLCPTIAAMRGAAPILEIRDSSLRSE
jgi:hypothetical protein